jgi:hypothetical protein
MSSQAAREQAYAVLVLALLSARTEAATDGFDHELAGGVRRGEVDPEAARRLRSWQRASVQAVVDHARAVLPAALAALDTSQRDLAETVEELAATLGAEPTRAGDGDTPGATSTRDTPAPSSLEERRQRMIVADLVTTPSDVQTDHR